MNTAIIIGAGPAGLTAAYELLKKTEIKPIILEKSTDIGGISKTLDYKGNKLDIGPHRLFSKSDHVMDWWLKILPLEESGTFDITYRNRVRTVAFEAGSKAGYDPDKVMLPVRRLSRIYYLRSFFAYPLQLSVRMLKIVGVMQTLKILLSYAKSKMSPRKPEATLEDFIINRFGVELYEMFFKDYTVKLWGVPCDIISAEWGAARIRGISLQKVLAESVKKLVQSGKRKSDIRQKGKEVGLLEQFLYPRRGTGSLWEEVARQVEEMGGVIIKDQNVDCISVEGSEIKSIRSRNTVTGEVTTWEGKYFFSTMPVPELVAGLGEIVPDNVKEVADGLLFRDFVTVGVLMNKWACEEVKDTWLYIQEKDVMVGRIMVYNNWGDGMIKDNSKIWIGMEYFCYVTDEFWKKEDHEIGAQAIDELIKMGLALREDVLDYSVQRMEKTYPAYFGTYDRFAEVREFTDKFGNLFLVGRNGMHKYNNSDHSMLTAIAAVDNIVAGVTSKENIWNIPADQEYDKQV